MLSLIKRAALEGNKVSSPVELMEATVIEAPPELKIKLKSNQKLIIPKELIIVAEHLTRHDRIISINYEYPKTWIKDPDIGDGDKSTSSSRVNIGSSPATPYENYQMRYAKVTYEDLLKIGDEILVMSLQGGQTFYITDRVIKYE